MHLTFHSVPSTMSELGIEKVVVELNGFRQRTAKSLSQLRDQLGGTTLSGFLALQGRYQSGEMSDQDYNAQKDYYKGEMANMIRKLDESKKLMMIMAQLDSRPPGGAQMPPGQQRPQPSQ